MAASDRHLEFAQAFDQNQRNRKIANLRATLEQEGQSHCVMCQEAINPARLLALPSARRCISCQQKSEKRA